VVSWLSEQPAWLLVALFVPGALLVGFAARLVALALIPPREREHACAIATALMTAFAATFALLIALTVSNEASSLNSTQNTVSAEAAQASVLAWASTDPGVHSAPIQVALGNYLKATRTYEWQGSAAATGEDPETGHAVSTLEREVRTQAANRDLSTSTSNELLSSLDGLINNRRQRLAAASRGLPDFYAVTVLVTGLALIVNISVVGIRSGLRPAAVGTSLAIVVGLSLALIFALATPLEGAITVSGSPLDAVIHDLTTGYFR
jgi:hypothetical protein